MEVKKNKKIKFLLVAYACEPDKGSEPGVGWQWVKIISHLVKERNGRVFVLTRANNKDVIQTKERIELPEKVRFIYYDLPVFLRFWKRGQRRVRAYYFFWQVGALFHIQRKFGRYYFDVIHHITFVNDWIPSLFSLLKNSKNIILWGPIGSHDKVPKIFIRDRRIQLFEVLKNIIQTISRRFNPLFRFSVNKTDIIIGINERVREKIKLPLYKKFKVIPAISVDMKEFNSFQCYKEANNFIVLSVGRFVYFKNFELTIRSFRRFVEKHNISESKLILIGDGEDKKFLQHLCNALFLNKMVEFKGWMPRKEALRYMCKADVFLFPSLEGGGMVVLEAMALGTPVICLDYGGPGEMVTDGVGYKVPIEGRQINEIIEEIADKLYLLYSNYGERVHKSEKAKELIEKKFSIQAKSREIQILYESFLKK